MIEKEFIQQWCRDHNLTEEFFGNNLVAYQHYTPGKWYAPGDEVPWAVGAKPHNQYWKRYRVAMRFLRQIVAEAPDVPELQNWTFTAVSGELKAERRQPADEFGQYDTVDFIWNEND